MEAYESILARRSVRKYTDKPIDDETMHKLLVAAMSGPSCANVKDTVFITVRDKESLKLIAQCNGRPAQMLPDAAAAIIICGDTEKTFQRAKDYWVVDASIATQNIVLAANALGLGSVWLGTWPQMERVENISKAFGLPENIIPHSVVALGYPAESPEAKSLYQEERVHHEKW